MSDTLKDTLQSILKSPILASLVIVFSIAGATWKVSSVLHAVSDQMTTEINTVKVQNIADLAMLNARIDKLDEDRYPLSLASERALRTAIENPGMRVPDPRDPKQVITVKIGSQP